MIFAVPIAAAGFASGWMLIWAAAGAIPIAIHFLMRRRQVKVRWAAMQLLLQVVEKEAKRVRIEQLLLLAVRVAILLTLTFALARPFLNRQSQGENPLDSPIPKLWILGIDTSYSMGYRETTGTRFQAALEKATEIVEASLQGDAYALVGLSAPCRAVIRRPTFNRQSALNELRRLKVLDTGCDLVSCLQTIRDIVTEAQRTEPMPNDIRVVLLSDLGADSWEAALSGSGARLIQELDNQVNMQVISLATDRPSNVAITTFAPSTSRPIVGRQMDLTMQVANFTRNDLKQLPVQLTANGQTVQSKYLDIQANSEEFVTFQLSPSDIGFTVFSATLPADSLAADNTRHFVANVHENNRILFVEAQPGDARLLRMSLTPQLAQGSQDTYDTISITELITVDLTDWDAIFLASSSILDSNQTLRFTDYVKNGGRLICTFGPETIVDEWSMEPPTIELLGFQLLEPSAYGDWSIDPLEYTSPVVLPFAGFPDAGLLTTPIFRFWRIRTDEPSDLTIDLASTTGEPLIVRNSLGYGSVASLLSTPSSGSTTGTEPSWNAIATWPSFVPLMQQLTLTVLNTTDIETNVFAGVPLQGRFTQETEATQVTIVRPDGSETQLLSETTPQTTSMTWEFYDTDSQGIYSVRDPSSNITPYAVNVNPTESSLTSIDSSQLSLKGSETSVTTTATQQERVGPAPQNDRLARILICILIALLATESTLAWFIGRRIG